jgi:hypothetical protein
MYNENIIEKIKIEFEGWHCIPKKETKKILIEARQRFKNANFIDNCGIIVETSKPENTLSFCLEILNRYKKMINSWDGYCIKKISKRIIYNYKDKKRKLSFEYFKKLIIENKFNDIKLVLAGILYLNLNEIKKIISIIEIDMNKQIIEMNEEELKISYEILIKQSSLILRKFKTSEETNE